MRELMEIDKGCPEHVLGKFDRLEELAVKAGFHDVSDLVVDIDKRQENLESLTEWFSSTDAIDSLFKYMLERSKVSEFPFVYPDFRPIAVLFGTAINDITAVPVNEAYFFEVRIFVRASNGSVYKSTVRVDKAELTAYETLHDMKVALRESILARLGTWFERNLEKIEPSKDAETMDRFTDAPAKMDPSKFKSLCDKLDKEAADGVRIPDNSSHNDSPCGVCTGVCETCTRPDMDS